MTFSFTIPMWIMYTLGGIGALVVLGLAVFGIMFILFLHDFQVWR